MKKVLISKPNFSVYSPTGYKMLQEKGYEIINNPFDRYFTLDEVLQICGKIDGVIADAEPWNSITIKASPNLKVIARFGSGMDTVDTETAKRHGIVCTNIPGSNAGAVAEHAIAMALCAVRNLIAVNRSTKAGKWKQYVFNEFSDATVGIVGFGLIGQQVAKKLRGFGCRILAYDTFPRCDLAEEYGVELVSFEEILTDSDVITLHVPLTEKTFHMINKDTLAHTKRGVIFVSEARGPVVDEKAMEQALLSGQVAFFTTDVFEHEPATPENTPLLRLDNVLASAHNGGETFQTLERSGIMTAQQIIDVFEGREPENRRA